MKKAAAIIAGLFVAGAMGFAVTTPASATEETVKVCPTWTLRGATGTYPAITFGDAPAGSEIVSATEVKLTKPTEGVMPGVEFATKNSGIDIDASDSADITVEYTLDDDADFVSGAVRLFYYSGNDANTISAPPTKQDDAKAKSGTLKLEGVTGHVGTLGLTYDGSNSAKGSVTFKNLKVNDTVVLFKDTCTPPVVPGSPSPNPTTKPSASPSPTNAALPTLPLTGSKGDGAGTAVKVGASVLGGGAILVILGILWARRNRHRFVA